MTLRIAWILLVCAIGACSAESDDKRDRCAKLQERLAELTVARSGGNLAPDEQAKHQANLIASSGKESVRRCVEEWSAKAIDCALTAGSVESIRACGARR